MNLLAFGVAWGACVVGFPLGIAYTLWATRHERRKTLRDLGSSLDFVRGLAKMPCEHAHPDGCTDEAMRAHGHARCLPCRAWVSWGRLPEWAR